MLYKTMKSRLWQNVKIQYWDTFHTLSLPWEISYSSYNKRRASIYDKGKVH